MKSSITAIAILLAGLTVSGCATYGGWQPTIDTYHDPNAARIPQDQSECEMLARNAGNTGMEAAKGVGVGALLGAAGGAALGAVAGNPGAGAAMGAAAGGIGGGAYSGLDADNQYKRAFINCMRERGHRVIN